MYLYNIWIHVYMCVCVLMTIEYILRTHSIYYRNVDMHSIMRDLTVVKFRKIKFTK